MYQSFFKLQRRPFSATPDPGCAYQVGSIQTAVDELVVCLERGEGIAVLTAPAGLGKTLLCEKVKQELGAGFVTLLLRHANFSTRADLLRTLLAELGRTSPAATSEHDARQQFLAALAELRQRGLLLVVICDEAHQLTEPLLEELRQMVDHADHGVSWVRVLLSGQLELEDRLAGTELSALNQRLRAHVALTPLTASESVDYIDYRITWAGGRTEEVFHPDTLTEIVAAADGIPRCINQLCDHVLLLAYVAEQQPARPELVREALADLQHLPLNWNIRAVRKPQTDHLDSETSESTQAEPRVAFGSHLQTWESSPTFKATASAAGGVWEFGAETSEETPPHAVETPPPPPDAFENFLETVETEIERLEAAAQVEDPMAGRILEEPVIDRYAAIDAGWPEEDLPDSASYSDETAAGRPAVSVPVEYPPSSARRQAAPSIALQHEPERQLQTEVLELVESTRDATGTRRFDNGLSHGHLPLIDELPTHAVETEQAVAMPQRPFRNLFTRLRRKQKGLE